MFQWLNQTVPTVSTLPVTKTVQTLPSVNTGAPLATSRSDQTVPTVPILSVIKTVPSVNSGAPVTPSKSEVPTVLIWGNQRPRVPELPVTQTAPESSENPGASLETPSKSESESQSFSATLNESLARIRALESQLKQTQSSEITQTPTTEITPVAGPSRNIHIKTIPPYDTGSCHR